MDRVDSMGPPSVATCVAIIRQSAACRAQPRLVAPPAARRRNSLPLKSLRFSKLFCQKSKMIVFTLHNNLKMKNVHLVPHKTKYNRSAMENERHLQCKALRRREKSRWRRSNGKQCEEQWEQ
jgi:hypothetical protein